jgi:membrane-associated phospholipid phosphatase
VIDFPEQPTVGRALNIFTAGLLTVYLLFVSGMLLLGRSSVSPDLFVIFALAIAAILGRTRLFLRDWLPFVAILLAWQAMRGLAWHVGLPVQSNTVIVMDRLLAFGAIPTEVLQQAFFVPGRMSLLDVITTSVYFLHFFATLSIAFVLWLIDRSYFYGFGAALLLLSLAQFVIATLIPVAPPRFAYLFGDDLAVTDIAQYVSNEAHLHSLSWAYSHLNANPFAAFPSLHAAYPLLAWLVLRKRWKRASYFALGYAGLVLFSIMYLGHHYLVDAIGGWILAYASYRAVEAFVQHPRRMARLSDLHQRWSLGLVPVSRVVASVRATWKGSGT